MNVQRREVFGRPSRSKSEGLTVKQSGAAAVMKLAVAQLHGRWCVCGAVALLDQVDGQMAADSVESEASPCYAETVLTERRRSTRLPCFLLRQQT